MEHELECDRPTLIRRGLGAYEPISTDMSYSFIYLFSACPWQKASEVSDYYSLIFQRVAIPGLPGCHWLYFIHVLLALNDLISCRTVHGGVCSFCAPLKLPDKHNALEIAVAVIDETDTGCFHTGVGKGD